LARCADFRFETKFGLRCGNFLSGKKISCRQENRATGGRNVDPDQRFRDRKWRTVTHGLPIPAFG
jgi:hypothetical protein